MMVMMIDVDFEEEGEGDRLAATTPTPPKVKTVMTSSSSVPLCAGDDDCDELQEENCQDLLVFGYQCKIFRDDERAGWVEDEKHLIPWMGDPELLIDRYDCRGALMDISRYEPEGSSSYYHQEDFQGELGTAEGNNNVALNEEEEEVLRRELNEERYRDLNVDEEDYDERGYLPDTDFTGFQFQTRIIDGMLSETGIQEQTGGTRKYAAFQYSYNETKSHHGDDICIIGPEPKRRLHDDEDDAPYVKPEGFYIPKEIVLPKTMKNHAVIEKTAKFIASQGNQMEIILKTKQAGNPLFDFQNHGDKLNPYYKWMVHAIRTGIYRPPAAEHVQDSAAAKCRGSEEDGDQPYLHPRLSSASNSVTSSSLDSSSATNPFSSIASAPSRHHHPFYSMLVSKIKGATTDFPDPLPHSIYSGTPVQLQHQAPPPPPLSFMSSSGHHHQINNHPHNTYGYGYSVPPPPPIVQPQRPQKQLPSSQDQLVIEKMASYVIKNGPNFEVLAKEMGDPRFGFLNLSHEYHWYYLNCKERFKAENSNNAMVAAASSSSDFVTCDRKSPPSQTTPTTTSSSTTVKKFAATELAAVELKRKTKNSKTGGGGCNSNSSPCSRSSLSPVVVSVPPQSVFSQAYLVKEIKDRPVIRFASSLSLNTLSSSSSTSTIVATVDHIMSTGHIVPRLAELPKEKQHNNSNSSAQPCLHSPSGVDSGNDEDDCASPFDDTGGSRTRATSDDEEQVRRRLERKRKAALFLQKLKMKNASDSWTVAGSILTEEKQEIVTTRRSPPPTPTPKQTHSSSSYQPNCKDSGGLTVLRGASLGDLLLSRCLQAHHNEYQEVASAQGVITLPPQEPVGDDEDNSNGIKTSISSSRHSSSKTKADRDSKKNHRKSSGSSSRKSKRRK